MQKINSKAGQIVRLQHTNTRFYGEVIQVIAERDLCWVRPLILALDWEEETTKVVDLRMSSDLFWPRDLFQLALDTEVIALLSQLEALDLTKLDENQARANLHDFISGFWREGDSCQ